MRPRSIPLLIPVFFLALPLLLRPQSPAAPAQQSPAITTQSSVVLVPALVRDGNGKLVYTLKADDFALTDDGAPQKLTLEPDSGGEPLALAVVVEVGGAGAREFQNYPVIALPLAPMLRSIVGGVRHRGCHHFRQSAPSAAALYVRRRHSCGRTSYAAARLRTVWSILMRLHRSSSQIRQAAGR